MISGADPGGVIGCVKHAWAQQPSTVQAAEWARRLSVVRTFARHRSATDPRTQIPPPGLLPFQPKRARPYLYSEEEICSLLRAALRMPYRYQRDKLRPQVFHCLLGLLSVSGLRLGEARNLELQDIDLKAAVLTIRGAKFGKTRLVPLHTSPARCWRIISPDVGVIGLDVRCPPICSCPTEATDWMGERFIARSMRCLGRSVCEVPPTVVALVCTTCVIASRTNTLVRWYRSGQDPERRLPLLSAYLGHVHVADTQWYLEGSPELMREAIGRLQQRWEARP